MRVADPIHLRTWRAELALRYEHRAGKSVLAERRHDGPLIVQKPLYPEGSHVCHTVLVHPPGGIAGGDELDFRADLGADARVLLTTPAASRWYRSPGPWARQHVSLTCSASAALEWLPQETIFFDGARARLDTHVQLAGNATFAGWDIFCLGRVASKERFRRGTAHIETRVKREDRTIWLERGRFDGASLFCSSMAALGNRTVFGTFIVAAMGLKRELLEACRGERPSEGEYAVTCPPGLLVARYLGDSTESAREYFSRLWQHARVALTGQSAHRPRIWST
jgi:urease accessory protein